MKKILSVLASLTIVTSGTSGTLAVLQKQNQQVPELPGQFQKINLETVLTKIELGILENGNEQEILKLAKFSNPSLNINEVKTTKINNQLALITPLKESQVYAQNLIGVQVTFKVKAKEQLTSVINQNNLGEIVDNSPENILKGLKKVNPTLNENEVSVRLNTITEQSAIIQAKLNGNYKSEIVVYYTLTAKKLNKDLVEPNLGFLLNNDEKTIFNALIKTNPNLVPTEFTLQNITLNSSKVVVNENSSIYDQDEVLINFMTNPYSLTDDLTVKDLGEIRSNSISEITKVLEEKTKVKISEIEIFDVTGLSFKIQAQADSHYYRVEDPINVSFVLPQKTDIQNIGDFKWVDHRSQEEIIQEIRNLIVKSAGNKDAIEYDKDFIIEGLESLNKDKEGQNETLLVVKSTRDSEYLTGQFNCEILPKINLQDWNEDQGNPVADDGNIISNLTTDITTQLTKINLKEDFATILKTLTIASTSKQYPFQHLSHKYYRNVDFGIVDNALFANKISWTNIPAPVYDSNDISIAIDNHPMISFVDSTNDKNYPDNPSVKTKYVNTNHNPTRAYWETTDPVEFGRIYYERDFNLSKDEFFTKYKIELNYKYSINAWVNKYGWKIGGGKNASLQSATKVFQKASDIVSPKTNSSQKEYNANGYDKSDGDFGSRYKAAGAIQIYMKIDETNKIIIIGGVAGSWFDWKNGSIYHHAGFARLKAESMKLVPKN